MRDTLSGQTPINVRATTCGATMSLLVPERVRLLCCALAAVLAVTAFTACTKREQRYITSWLKVDIRRPVTGTSGVIVLGSRNEVFHANIAGRWKRLGVGHTSSYMILGEEQAVLLELNDGNGLQLVTQQAAPRPIRKWFAEGGEGVSVPPGIVAIDVFKCAVRAEPSGCRDVRIDRYNVDGTAMASFQTALPQTYSDCQQTAIKGYDSAGIPYVISQCSQNSTQAKCILTAARPDGPFLYAVAPDRRWSECSEFPGAGVSLTDLQHFVVFDRE